MNRWFLLDDGGMTGAENMARDEFLLERAERTGGPPVLRLYSFRPPALTIGYHQDPEEVLDLDAVQCDRVDLVRRITGGRALLHEDELTYAVAAPCGTGPFRAGLAATFVAISGALVAALRGLGIDAAVGGGGPRVAGRGRVTPCLVSIGRYEIAVRGRKIAGSAQRRRGSAFLQHGSILLGPASSRIAAYARGDWPFLGEQITSIMQERGAHADEAEVRSSLVRAFTAAFDVRWEGLVLADGELAAVERRALEKRGEFASLTAREAGG